jgi:GxxExxY protein
MIENEITKIIIDTAYKIHTKIGPGLLESAYQAILVHELKKRGLHVDSEISMPIHYEDVDLDVGFRVDLLVENKVIIELKSIEKVAEVHKKQLLTYLRISGLQVGLLINFGAPLIKDGIFRIVNGFKEEKT